jgi:nitrogen regulatory protein P-II 1
MDYDLLITIVNRGFADTVMDAARSKGAKGGTIVNARGTAGEAEKFFNISIQPEKEMVLIVVPHDIRAQIMEEIILKAGLKTDGQGIIVSVPVESATGLK